MKRFSSTTNIEDLVSFSLKQLKELGFFHNEGYKSQVLTFKKRSFAGTHVVGKIWLGLSTQDGSEAIELDYIVDGNEINYKIPLVRVPSNLGAGFLFYAICPVSKTRCRKLYLDQDRFVSRKAIEGKAYYRQEIISKSSRSTFKTFKKLKKNEKILKEWTKPNFFASFQGVITKRCQILLDARAENDRLTGYY